MQDRQNKTLLGQYKVFQVKPDKDTGIDIYRALLGIVKVFSGIGCRE